MSRVIRDKIKSLNEIVEIHFVVENVLGNVIDQIESNAISASMGSLSREVADMKSYTKTLLKKYKLLQEKYHESNRKYRQVQNQAEIMREQIVCDLGPLIREGKRVHTMREKMHTLQYNLSEALEEVENLKEQLRKANSSSQPTTTTTPMKLENSSTEVATVKPISVTKTTITRLPTTKMLSILHELDGTLMLKTFSFLETIDVLSAAQVSRYVYARVYQLFGIESSNIHESWRVKPSANPPGYHDVVASSGNSASKPTTTSANGTVVNAKLVPSSTSTPQATSQNFAESLSKKLTGIQPHLLLLI
jgi:hypothetical protein